MAIILRRSVPSSVSPARTWAYLADFTNTTEWDPGTVSTTLTSGDGTVGTTYANTSRFLGRTVHLTYRVTEHDPGRLLVLQAQQPRMLSRDTIEVHPDHGADGGCTVTYTAEFTFSGLTRLVEPLLTPAFERLGDRAEAGMRQALAHSA